MPQEKEIKPPHIYCDPKGLDIKKLNHIRVDIRVEIAVFSAVLINHLAVLVNVEVCKLGPAPPTQ